MHGMATDEEMRRLRDVRGAEAEVLFLQLMIRHHEGGVVMARALEGLSRRDEVLGMARSIDSTQRAEIAEMTEMLGRAVGAAVRVDLVGPRRYPFVKDVALLLGREESRLLDRADRDSIKPREPPRVMKGAHMSAARSTVVGNRSHP